MGSFRSQWKGTGLTPGLMLGPSVSLRLFNLDCRYPRDLLQPASKKKKPASKKKSTGEDLAQGVGFWYAFLTSFWGPTTMVLSKREGLVAIPCLDKGWILAWSFGCLFL